MQVIFRSPSLGTNPPGRQFLWHLCSLIIYMWASWFKSADFDGLCFFRSSTTWRGVQRTVRFDQRQSRIVVHLGDKNQSQNFFFLKETQKYTNWLNAGMERVLKKYWVCVGVRVCVVSPWKRVYACASVCCKPGRGVEVLDIRNWRPGLSHNRDMCSTVKDEPHTTWKSASVTLLERSSRVWLCDHVDYSPPGCSVHGDFPGKKTGVGCRSPL